MESRHAFGQTRPVCPDCGHIHFDDPKVAAVAFVEKEKHVLLVRRNMNPGRGKWALPAGYVDFGEAPADAAKREVYEETNLEVEITELIDVYGTDGSHGASIVIIYKARVTNGKASAQDDADAVMWYSAREALPDIAFESTRNMLTQWIASQKQS